MFLLLSRTLQTEEQWPRPSRAGDLTSDFRERLKALSSKHKSVFQDGHLMLCAVPFPDQHRAGFDAALGVSRERTAGFDVACDATQQASRLGLETAESLLLKSIGQGHDHQRTAKPVGRIRSVERLPLRIQLPGT